jgi:hypothetical protein
MSPTELASYRHSTRTRHRRAVTSSVRRAGIGKIHHHGPEIGKNHVVVGPSRRYDRSPVSL